MFTGLLDMIDGGGAGQSGPEFEGGPISGLLNALGVKPHGWRDRYGQGVSTSGNVPTQPNPSPMPPPQTYMPQSESNEPRQSWPNQPMPGMVRLPNYAPPGQDSFMNAGTPVTPQDILQMSPMELAEFMRSQDVRSLPNEILDAITYRQRLAM